MPTNPAAQFQPYADFIDQSVDWPVDGFEVEEATLQFQGVDLMALIQEHGTPLRFTYLPLIGKKIERARLLFQEAILNHDYRGSYTYCYCTKSAHFKFILDECLKSEVHLETSSAYDIPLIRHLHAEGKFPKERLIVCNGFKPEHYLDELLTLREEGFENIIPVIDNLGEFDYFEKRVQKPTQLGVRLAIDEPSYHDHYTSRLGLPQQEILDFYRKRVKPSPNFSLTMLHFFTQGGIKDTPYFWNEFRKAVHLYCTLRQLNPELRYLNIGGGLPHPNSLDFDYDYPYMINELVGLIKDTCSDYGLPEPDLVTEFGSYTVSEASGVLFRVVARKRQNDKETWNMLDGSLMTTLPDIWALRTRYILLPVNNWDAGYERVILGGNTCDAYDYYAEDAHSKIIFLPKAAKAPQYLGFFHTGAYQEALSGVGGIHHCLIPTPKHVLIRRDDEAATGYSTEVFADTQQPDQVMRILGY